MTPLSLTVGQTFMFQNPIYLTLTSTPIVVNGILPLCIAKFDLNAQEDTFRISAFGDCTIDQVIYSLDNYVDSNGIYVIRPSREYLFSYYTGNMDPGRVNTGLEAIDDLQMDILLKVSDALIANGTIVLNSTESANYNKLKTQWQATTSVTLDTATYEIDYALENGTPTDGPGLKSLARQYMNDYKEALVTFKYIF